MNIQKVILSAVLMLGMNIVFSQDVLYASLKRGLGLRDQPSSNGKVLEMIPYGQMINVLPDGSKKISISLEGFSGVWQKVNYNNTTGYVVSSYLLPSPPPGESVKTFADYLAQITAPSGKEVVIKKGKIAFTGNGSIEKKQLYKNGMRSDTWEFYEAGTETYTLPKFSIEQCFLLLRLLHEWTDAVGENDMFPSKNGASSDKQKNIKVQRGLINGKLGAINKINISSSDEYTGGGAYTLDIYILKNQAVISYSSGV